MTGLVSLRIDVYSIFLGQRCLAARNAPSNGGKPNNSKGYYEFEDEIVFSCDRGYNLVGGERTVCQNDGTWSNPAPICQSKTVRFMFLHKKVDNAISYWWTFLS